MSQIALLIVAIGINVGICFILESMTLILQVLCDLREELRAGAESKKEPTV